MGGGGARGWVGCQERGEVGAGGAKRSLAARGSARSRPSETREWRVCRSVQQGWPCRGRRSGRFCLGGREEVRGGPDRTGDPQGSRGAGTRAEVARKSEVRKPTVPTEGCQREKVLGGRGKAPTHVKNFWVMPGAEVKGICWWENWLGCVGKVAAEAKLGRKLGGTSKNFEDQVDSGHGGVLEEKWECAGTCVWSWAWCVQVLEYVWWPWWWVLGDVVVK